MLLAKLETWKLFKALIDLVEYSGPKWILDLGDNNGETPLQLWIEAKRTLKLKYVQRIKLL